MLSRLVGMIASLSATRPSSHARGSLPAAKRISSRFSTSASSMLMPQRACVKSTPAVGPVSYTHLTLPTICSV